MDSARVTVYLMNELPAVGCGWREVSVRRGRKWCHVEYRGRSHRVRRDVFERVERETMRMTERAIRQGIAVKQERANG